MKDLNLIKISKQSHMITCGRWAALASLNELKGV
jgi:hypothetical protein